MHASSSTSDPLLVVGDVSRNLRASTRNYLIAASGVLFAAQTGVLAYLGYLWMFSGFQPYDDEGSMLIALRGYISGHALYDQISIQYGPFFFEFFRVFGALGMPFDLDSGRLVTLAVWLAIALLSGVAVFVFARNLALGLSTQLIAFGSIPALTHEPMHPGGLVLLLVTGVAAIAMMSAGHRSYRKPFLLIGALVAAAILTKINVGIFAAISVGFACALTFPALVRAWPVRLVAAAVFVAVPFLLMKAELNQEWFQRYAINVGVCALALVVVTSTSLPDPDRRLRELAWLIAGGAALTVVTVAVALFTGSSLNGLLHGVILNPLQQAGTFTLPLDLPVSTLKWDAVGLGGASLWVLYRVLAPRPQVGLEGAVRVFVGLFIWLTLIGSIAVTGLFQVTALNNRLVLPAAFAWIVAAPRGRLDGYEKLDFVRAVLPSIAILQTLHAFPVAGSQQDFSALMLVPLGAICIGDGLVQLAHTGLGGVREQAVGALVFLTIAISWLPTELNEGLTSYASDVNLGLPGATRVRVPAGQAAVLRQVTQALRTNCDNFISVPGLDSYYLFGQFNPPTAGPTRWMWLSNNVQQQQAAVAVSDRVNRLCVLENQDLISFWLQGRPDPNGPLVDYIQQGFVQVDAVGPYSLLVRR